MSRLYKSSKGVTLIELIVVMATIGIVFMLIYSMNLFGIRTFAKGDNRANVQSEARMALDYITKEVRYASKVEILTDASSVPSSVSDDNCYIYLDESDTPNKIKFKDKLGEKIIATFTDVDFEFSTTNNKVLKYNINGTEKAESFSIYSDVMPLNMPSSNNIVNSSGGGKVVKYIKGDISNANTLVLQSTAYDVINVNNSYTKSFTTSGGTAPYTYKLLSDPGDLPNVSGLNLDGTMPDGELTFSPNSSNIGTFTYAVKVTDSSSPVLYTSRYFTVVVKDTSVADHPPVASAVKITGVPKVSYTLTGSYTYKDDERDPESTSIYKWYIGSSADVTSADEVSGNTSNSYVVASGDLGKYIFFEVTPAALASSGIVKGLSVLSEPVQIVTNCPPVVTNVIIKVNTSINSEAKIEDELTFVYNYSDLENNSEGATAYQWLRMDSDGTNVVTVGSGTVYNVKAGDEGKKIFVRITPVDSTGNTGNAVISSSVSVKTSNGGKKNN